LRGAIWGKEDVDASPRLLKLLNKHLLSAVAFWAVGTVTGFVGSEM